MENSRNLPLLYKKGMVFLAILVLAGIECNTAFVKNATIGAMFGRSDIPCTYWPPLETARRILGDHSDTIQKLHQVPDSWIWQIQISENDGLGWLSQKCPGRGILIIQTYANHEEMMMMRDIIGDDRYFFGMPYVMFDS